MLEVADAALPGTYVYDPAKRLIAAIFENGRRIFYDPVATHDRERKQVTSQLVIEPGPASPGAYTATQGQIDRTLIQTRLIANDEEAVDVTFLRFKATGTIDETTDLASIRLYLDVDGSGSLSTADGTALATATFSGDDGSVGFALATPLTIPMSAAADVIVVADMGATAPADSTIQVSLDSDDDLICTGVDSGRTILPLGAPAVGSVITVSASPDLTPPAFAGLDPIPPGGVVAHLTWPAVADPSAPVKYLLWQSETADFVPDPTPDRVIIGATSFDVSGLNLEEDYYFIVRAEDGAGNRESNTVRRTFRPTDAAPPVFAGLQVAAFDGTTTGTARLAWDAAADDLAPLNYHVWHSTAGDPNPDFDTPLTSTPSLDVALSGLAGGILHRVIVRASDPQGNRDSNLIYRRISYPSAPFAPADPPDSSTDVPLPVTLSMQPAIDPDGMIATYFFEVWREETGPDGQVFVTDYLSEFTDTPASPTDPATFAPADYFQYNLTYKWRARAWDDSGVPGELSPTLTFTASDGNVGVKEWMLLGDSTKRMGR